MHKSLNRRSFLRLGTLAGMATALPLAHARPVQRTPDVHPGVKRYVTLGRTGLQISDISFGSSRLRRGEERLVRHALDRGINYFDTAESYTGGTAETVLGNALKGERDKVFIATKAFAGAADPHTDIMKTLESSLRRLQTDYVDVFFSHAVNDVERLKNLEWFEFVERAKHQGKIRFTGMSGHAGRLVQCVDYALDHNMVDVILLAHNFGQDPAFYERFTQAFDFVARQPDLPRVMTKAQRAGVGVIAMKVLRGARLNDMRPFEKDGLTYAQAAFKWALSGGNIDAAIISMTSTDLIDEYLGASGDTAITDYDVELLTRYAQLTDTTYCRRA